MTPPLRRAAFLDRDGVINIDSEYLSRWEDFQFIPGSVEAMRLLQQAGYALVVVTNQSGIARGYYSEDDYQLLTRQMRAALQAEGVTLAGIYHCPHHPAGRLAAYAVDCDCRKPRPGLLRQAAAELGLQMDASFLVGDKLSDIQAARAAGVGRAYLVRSGHALQPAETAQADGMFADLAACARHLLAGPAGSPGAESGDFAQGGLAPVPVPADRRE